MVRDDEHVGLIADVQFFESLQHRSQVPVRAVQSGQGGFGAGAALMLGEVGITEPEQGEPGDIMVPKAARQGGGGPLVLGEVGKSDLGGKRVAFAGCEHFGHRGRGQRVTVIEDGGFPGD